MHLASYAVHLDIVDMLLENGADPTIYYSRRWEEVQVGAALEWARAGGDADTIARVTDALGE